MAITVAEVDTVIQAIESGGQSFTLDGMSYSQANLDALIRLRDRLNAEALRSSRPLFRAMNFGAMGYD